jgi:hypothetical protein
MTLEAFSYVMKFYNDSTIWSVRFFLFQKQKEFKIASHYSGH